MARREGCACDKLSLPKKNCLFFHTILREHTQMYLPHIGVQYIEAGHSGVFYSMQKEI